MTDEIIIAEQAVVLGSFIAPLQANGYSSELLDVSDELDLPTLVVSLDDDASNRQRLLTVNLMPPELGGDVDVSLLQIYAPLPFRLPDEHRGEFGRFALSANGLTPTTAIGARDNGEIYLRHMAAVPSSRAPEGALIAGLVALTEYQSDVFGASIEAVASGAQSADEALAELTAG